ncbi:MAG TPA: M14 family metallopeptidase [Steroidobacteraceae bacterium]|nr:M14 family metallopeptidase [Steroidobacteraceae bacterium]
MTIISTFPGSGPLTRAESTGYRQTSTHADVLAFIEALRVQGDARLRVTDFGRTPEGRLLPLLILSNHGCFTPEDAVSAGLPVVLVQCGIHAGEVEGKEAALMLVRDLLDGRHGALLDRLTLLVAPLFNADGNDRIDPQNRKLDIEHFHGQKGPLGVGTRENAAGINLNRDYMRQQGAEMRLMQSRVCQPWNPHLVVDCHTTNGSIHRFAMTFDIPHVPDSGRREPIDYMRRRLLPAVQAAVKAHDGLDSFWYGNFLRDEGGEGMGWITYPHHPRFGGNYRGLTNRLDLLLETYSYLPFAERVRTTYGFLRETLEHVASHGEEILRLLAACVTPPDEIAVKYRLEAFDHAPAEILTREPYTSSGAPVAVRVPYIGRFIGEQPVTRPPAYAVPPRVAEHLVRHGLDIDAPAGAALDAEIAVVRKRVVVGGRGILEADSSVHLDVELTRQRRTLPDGWRLVRTAQQRGAIAVYLCEAGSDDGLLACELIDAPDAGAEFPAWRIHAVTDVPRPSRR